MHSEYTKIADLVIEYLQKKTKEEEEEKEKGMVGTGSRKGKGEEEGTQLLPPPLISATMIANAL
jgi:hypothetical protein